MKTSCRFRIIAAIAMPLAAVGVAVAQETRDAGSARTDNANATLSPIVVVATRTPRAQHEVAGTVTVVEAVALDNRLAVDLSDIVRYEPAISAVRAGTRFGWSGFNVRGVGGNRVAIELDGVPVADGFAIGSYSNAGRDLVDLDVLERVEVLYGPASSLYGSDALGGVVSYRTYAPERLAGQGAPYLGLRGAYHGDDASYHAAATGAWVSGPFGALVSASRREGAQREARAASGLPEDRQQWSSANLFGKLTWDLGATTTFTAIGDRFERNADTTLQAILGHGRFRSTTRLEGADHAERERLTLALDIAPSRSWLQSGRITGYSQRSSTAQESLEERASRDLRYQRRFDYRQRTTGIGFDATLRAQGARLHHAIGYGLEVTQTSTAESRDGFQETLAGQDRSHVVLGEALPVRDFPLSTTTELGFYVHDEIELGAWSLVPALRFDHYDLDPDADALYRADNPHTTVATISASNLSPKLGFTWTVSPTVALFGQYARGFRAPPFEDANIGLDIPLFNIRALPNPDLESETSDGLELGLRRTTADSALSVSAHYTRYEDFIESRVRIGVDADSGTLLFQSRNVDRARIHGAEVRWRQRLGAWSQRLGGLELTLAAAWSRGEDQSTGAPLETIDPAQLVTALDWQAQRAPLRLGAAWTVVADKSDIDDPDQTLARAPGFGVIDLTARYRLAWRHSQDLELRAGVFNALDHKHWQWASVRGRDRDDPTLPLLSEPGRTFGASFKFTW